MWETAAHLAVAVDVFDGVIWCCPNPHDVLDETWDLIEYTIGGVIQKRNRHKRAYRHLHGDQWICANRRSFSR